MKRRAKAKPKRKRRPTVKEVGTRVASSLGAKTGSQQLSDAVRRYNGALIGWRCTAKDNGEQVFVPGCRDRWYDARARGVTLINGARIAADPKAELVSIDGVVMVWVEQDAQHEADCT